MTVWRPPQTVGVKVLGLAWKDGRLLAAEVQDSLCHVTGVRPLGGSIEFGETREAALKREFREELGCEIEISGPWHCVENIFEHEGCKGHEFIFAASIRLLDTGLADKEEIIFFESDGGRCVARWVSPLGLPDGLRLFPRGLAGLIGRGVIRA